MDVHTFIKHVRNDEENDDFVNKIEKSINKSILYVNSDLFLKLPVVPENMAKNRAAIYIHGNMFEEFVLKAAKGERSNDFAIKDESIKTVWSRIKERKKQFKEIHNENMTQDYEDVMTRAGIRAWETLSSLARSRNCSNHECEVKFEEVVQNKTSSELKEYLRADFVARTETSVFLVDLKFSSMETSAFEEQYLVNGILQVLIYSLVMGIEPGDLSLGVLVYYGREGMIVLYTTDIRNDQESMKILRQIIGISNHSVENGTAERRQLHDVHKLGEENSVGENKSNTCTEFPKYFEDKSIQKNQSEFSKQYEPIEGRIEEEMKGDLPVTSECRGLKRKDKHFARQCMNLTCLKRNSSTTQKA